MNEIDGVALLIYLKIDLCFLLSGAYYNVHSAKQTAHTTHTVTTPRTTNSSSLPSCIHNQWAMTHAWAMNHNEEK